ncbi:hypothetical protein KG112_08240 [Nocardioides sp. zg-ZUI104]|uniref:hypothetical protein n=1 Tax=Nocardioides faecalis TaxID=2803858 RepID=UPI001BCFA6DF|nr:hypothetical protein [Nocardioides faecalis]MBS4752792.1 hypothetical protein [Nocardioides faecalis]
MLPRFEIVARHRPVTIVGTPQAGAAWADGDAPDGASAPLPQAAPSVAIEVMLPPTGADAPPAVGVPAVSVPAVGEPGGPTAVLRLSGPDGSLFEVRLVDGDVALTVDSDGTATRHRSRRRGRVRQMPTGLALTLTGTQLAALTCEDGAWLVRARVDLTGRVDVRDPGWLAGLRGGWETSRRGTVAGWSAGGFGQLGLRDVRLVTHADGTPYRVGEDLLFTATSAGPGFFGTAHTSVWRMPEPVGEQPPVHCADLFFTRNQQPQVYGDHATHLLRDGDEWLVATSTWSDFPDDRAARRTARVAVALARTGADLTRGRHVLPAQELALPDPAPLTGSGPSVGMWDPHLVRTETGEWLVGYVSARRFFDFHPVLASGPSLDDLTLRGAAGDRRATEGTTITRIDGEWRVLASDGRDNPRGRRARMPVLDLALADVGVLDAPYPTNIPWPSVVAPDPGHAGRPWSLLTFDGTPSGGRLAGYGTHGDLVVMREAASGSGPAQASTEVTTTVTTR